MPGIVADHVNRQDYWQGYDNRLYDMAKQLYDFEKQTPGLSTDDKTLFIRSVVLGAGRQVQDNHGSPDYDRGQRDAIQDWTVSRSLESSTEKALRCAGSISNGRSR